MSHVRGVVRGVIRGLMPSIDAPPPIWSIAGTTQITEDAANAVYTVSYVNPLSPGQTATIRAASVAGTATDSVDYTGVATTITFTGGGATSKTLAVTIIEDTIVEGTEDFLVTLASASSGTIAVSQVNTLIVDEDATNLQWTVSGPTSIDEGDTGTYTVSYTGVTLAPGQQAVIHAAAVDNSLATTTWPAATANVDFTTISTTLTFTAGGATAKTLAVSTIEDTAVEGTEDFTVTISGQTIGQLAQGSQITLIIDDDTAWQIVGPTSITEGDTGTYTVSYTGIALGPGVTATIVAASADGGTTFPNAEAGTDYTALSTTLSFTGGGVTAKTVAVSTIEDTIFEGTEDFLVSLASPSVGVLGTSQAVTLIAEDDASNLVWTVSGPTTVNEGDTATYTVNYTGVTLAPGQQAIVTVASATGGLTWPDGTAGVDYTALSSALTFTAGGVTQKTVAVSTIEDTDIEGTEDFRVTLGGASIGSFAASQVNTIIVDDDAVTPLLDAVGTAAKQAYSVRKLRAAYAGSCLRIRRSSDNAESDFGFDGSGNLDTAAIATFVGGGSGFVVTWYDQSGNADNAAQSTAGNQPTYLASSISSKPTLDFIPNSGFNMTGPVAHSTWTALAVCIYEENNSVGHILSNNVTNRQHRLRRNSNQISLFAGTTLTLAYAGNWALPHLFGWENRGSNVGEIWADGVSLGTGDPGTGSFNCIEIAKNNTLFVDCKITEVIVFGSNLSSGDRVIAEADIMAYWGL